MGIRDVVMLVLGYGCVPLALYDAYYGLLAYCWLSFMRPQTFVWSTGVQSARITLAVGAALVLRAILSEGPKLRLRSVTLGFLALWGWYGVSTLASSHYAMSVEPFIDFCKVGVAVVLVTGLVRTREQLKWLVLVLAACPGAYALKMGLAFFRGVSVTHHGGPLGMDNNDTAMFIAMGVPMLVFAAGDVAAKWPRRALYAVAVLAVPAVIITASRGGILTLAAAGAITVWRKTTWWKAVAVGAVGLALAWSAVPEKTMQRYETVGTYEEDPSAVGRLWAWETSVAMAADRPLTGVGLGMATYMAEYDGYKRHPEDHPHVAHSVWFDLLGQTGYVGLGLYLGLITSVLLATRRVRKLVAAKPVMLRWAKDYAVMLECTVLTFAVGATFLSKLEFEFIYVVLLLAVPLLHLTERAASAAPDTPQPTAAKEKS